MRLYHGKIPADILQEVIFKNLGAKRKEVVLGPSIGIDGAVIDVDDKSVIVSTDPITGAVERIGWLAVNINANDISTFGVPPTVFFSSILLPENANRKTVETISVEMNRAAEKLRMAIAGGHCEVTPGLVHPIVVGCAMGMTKKGNYVTAGGAKPEDKIILTKTAGIEGTAILATDREKQLKKELSSSLITNAQKFFRQISVSKEALLAFRTGGVDAMHDPTEGGVAGAVHEMADASKLGFEIYEANIPVAKETRGICHFFGIDPLYLIASGSMLIAAKASQADKIVETLRQRRVRANIIGEFSASLHKRSITKKDGSKEQLARPVCDHLWVALEK